MRRACRTVRLSIAAKAAVLGVAIVIVLLSRPAWPATRSGSQTRERPPRTAENPLVKPGEYPPDFNLPRLTFSTDAAGKPVGVINQQDRIKLSSFRGKRPVCMIMSSYT